MDRPRISFMVIILVFSSLTQVIITQSPVVSAEEDLEIVSFGPMRTAYYQVAVEFEVTLKNNMDTDLEDVNVVLHYWDHYSNGWDYITERYLDIPAFGTVSFQFNWTPREKDEVKVKVNVSGFDVEERKFFAIENSGVLVLELDNEMPQGYQIGEEVTVEGTITNPIDYYHNYGNIELRIEHGSEELLFKIILRKTLAPNEVRNFTANWTVPSEPGEYTLVLQCWYCVGDGVEVDFRAFDPNNVSMFVDFIGYGQKQQMIQEGVTMIDYNMTVKIANTGGIDITHIWIIIYDESDNTLGRSYVYDLAPGEEGTFYAKAKIIKEDRTTVDIYLRVEGNSTKGTIIEDLGLIDSVTFKEEPKKNNGGPVIDTRPWLMASAVVTVLIIIFFVAYTFRDGRKKEKVS